VFEKAHVCSFISYALEKVSCKDKEKRRWGISLPDTLLHGKVELGKPLRRMEEVPDSRML
jgi:hypothetical protein